MKSEQYISIPELAKALGVSRIAVYKKVKKGVIQGVKVGRNFVVSKEYLHKKIDQEQYTSIPQLAQSLNISRRAVLQKVKAGIIKGEKVGRNFVVSQEYIEQKKQEDDCLSIPQLAKLLKVSRIAVYKKVQKGTIEAKKVGKKYLISKEYIRKNYKGILSNEEDSNKK